MGEPIVVTSKRVIVETSKEKGQRIETKENMRGKR